MHFRKLPFEKIKGRVQMAAMIEKISASIQVSVTADGVLLLFG